MSTKIWSIREKELMKLGEDITGQNLYIGSCTLLFLWKFGRYLGQNSHRWGDNMV